MNLNINRFLNSGSGVILQGVLWMLFWLGPAFPLFQQDLRWGHNFALPLIFIAVGLAYYSKRISCQLVGVIASFLIVPVELAFLPWDLASIIAIIFLVIIITLHSVEHTRNVEILNPRPRLKVWLKIHILNLAYIGLAHMPLIFFLIRWFNPGPFTTYLPIEHEPSTSIYNLMLLVLAPLAIMEKYVGQIGHLKISNVSFIWAILMIVFPLLSISFFGS